MLPAAPPLPAPFWIAFAAIGLVVGGLPHRQALLRWWGWLALAHGAARLAVVHHLPHAAWGLALACPGLLWPLLRALPTGRARLGLAALLLVGAGALAVAIGPQVVEPERWPRAILGDRWRGGDLLRIEGSALHLLPERGHLRVCDPPWRLNAEWPSKARPEVGALQLHTLSRSQAAASGHTWRTWPGLAPGVLRVSLEEERPGAGVRLDSAVAGGGASGPLGPPSPVGDLALRDPGRVLALSPHTGAMAALAAWLEGPESGVERGDHLLILGQALGPRDGSGALAMLLACDRLGLGLSWVVGPAEAESHNAAAFATWIGSAEGVGRVIAREDDGSEGRLVWQRVQPEVGEGADDRAVQGQEGEAFEAQSFGEEEPFGRDSEMARQLRLSRLRVDSDALLLAVHDAEQTGVAARLDLVGATHLLCSTGAEDGARVAGVPVVRVAAGQARWLQVRDDRLRAGPLLSLPVGSKADEVWFRALAHARYDPWPWVWAQVALGLVLAAGCGFALARRRVADGSGAESAREREGVEE